MSTKSKENLQNSARLEEDIKAQVLHQLEQLSAEKLCQLVNLVHVEYTYTNFRPVLSPPSFDSGRTRIASWEYPLDTAPTPEPASQRLPASVESSGIVIDLNEAAPDWKALLREHLHLDISRPTFVSRQIGACVLDVTTVRVTVYYHAMPAK